MANNEPGSSAAVVAGSRKKTELNTKGRLPKGTRKSVSAKEGAASLDDRHAANQMILELAKLVMELARQVTGGGGGIASGTIVSSIEGSQRTMENLPLRAKSEGYQPVLALTQSLTSRSENLTVSEVAAILRVTTPTVREHIKAGRLEAIRGSGGRTYLVKRDAVEKFLAGSGHDDQQGFNEKVRGVLGRLGN